MFRLVRAFFAKARGAINTFRIPATAGKQNSNGGVTASAIAAAGATTMNITGEDTDMLAGQFVTVNGQLLQLTEDQSGATLTFEPPLRAQVAAGTRVVTSEPYALVHMAESAVTWVTEIGGIHAASFAVEEAILETDGAAPEATAAPFNTVAPSLTGTALEGETLTVTNGTWNHSPTSYTRQWLRGGFQHIGGATGTTYTLTAGDVGHTISVRVTATNATGSTSADSNSKGPVVAPAPPANTALPTISGTPTVGYLLTASNGTWSGSPTSYAYQWKRGGVAISGATASTYELVAADSGANITLTVTATNAYGSTAATSAAVGPVAANAYADYLLADDFDSSKYWQEAT